MDDCTRAVEKMKEPLFVCGTRAVVHGDKPGLFWIVCSTCQTKRWSTRQYTIATKEAVRDATRPCRQCGEATKPTKWRHCLECSRPARRLRPNDDGPYWCSQRCATAWAIMHVKKEWCASHGWYHADDGCQECQDPEL